MLWLFAVSLGCLLRGLCVWVAIVVLGGIANSDQLHVSLGCATDAPVGKVVLCVRTERRWARPFPLQVALRMGRRNLWAAHKT